jgi:DNA-binding PadR family transcriptional regulator
MRPNPRQFLPLKPVDFQLLLALAEGDRHGYALVQAIAERTDGIVTLEPGNLYRVIKRLLADGLVVETERRVVPELDDERRRYYRLTALGGRVLAEEVRRLEALVSSPAVRAVVQRWAT